jgi:hypothetical protein
MAHPKKDRSAPQESRPAPPPPARRLGPCPACGCTVLADAWHGEPLRPIGPCTSPVKGDPHDCALALVQYAVRWGWVVRLYKCAPVVYTGAASMGGVGLAVQRSV